MAFNMDEMLSELLEAKKRGSKETPLEVAQKAYREYAATLGKLVAKGDMTPEEQEKDLRDFARTTLRKNNLPNDTKLSLEDEPATEPTKAQKPAAKKKSAKSTDAPTAPTSKLFTGEPLDVEREADRQSFIAKGISSFVSTLKKAGFSADEIEQKTKEEEQRLSKSWDDTVGASSSKNEPAAPSAPEKDDSVTKPTVSPETRDRLQTLAGITPEEPEEKDDTSTEEPATTATTKPTAAAPEKDLTPNTEPVATATTNPTAPAPEKDLTPRTADGKVDPQRFIPLDQATKDRLARRAKEADAETKPTQQTAEPTTAEKPKAPTGGFSSTSTSTGVSGAGGAFKFTPSTSGQAKTEPTKTTEPEKTTEPKKDTEPTKATEPASSEPSKPVQPWSRQGREMRAKELDAMSPEEKAKEKDRSMRRLGFRPEPRGVGDRLKSAWKAFTAKPGEKIDIQQGYKSVFAEVQRLMEQLHLIESVLVHESAVMEGLKGGQTKLDVAPPFGQLTAADFAKLRARRDEIRKVLVGQMVREELYKHNTTLAELNPHQRSALSETIKKRSSTMWEQLAEIKFSDWENTLIRASRGEHPIDMVPNEEEPTKEEPTSDKVDERIAANKEKKDNALIGKASAFHKNRAAHYAQGDKSFQRAMLKRHVRGPDYAGEPDKLAAKQHNLGN